MSRKKLSCLRTGIFIKKGKLVIGNIARSIVLDEDEKIIFFKGFKIYRLSGVQDMHNF